MSAEKSGTRRTHIILIPGFGGFDALGQIHYYAGLTPQFRRWLSSRRNDAGVVLHYFDNLPTAAVTTRAARLRAYLAKRLARREFQPGDALALVGHSTGGLDIRRLLWDLSEHPEAVEPVDRIADDEPWAVERGEILKMVERVVFLSVPQRGCNIAGWVMRNSLLRRRSVKAIRDAVFLHPVRPATFATEAVLQCLAEQTGSDVFRAALDALKESDEFRTGNDPIRAAAAREAYAELRLWTQHIAVDFSAIEDLEYRAGSGGTSPAHFDERTRAEEVKRWKRNETVTRSYATIAESPFEPAVLRSGKAWSHTSPRTWPTVGLRAEARTKTDALYRWCYRACAGGTFTVSDGQRTATCFDTKTRREVEDWENDGIANTASMLWPDGPDTLLVKGDHGDIIGHFHPCKVNPPAGRERASYDLLCSGSGFGQQRFESVWNDVFDFCVMRT